MLRLTLRPSLLLSGAASVQDGMLVSAPVDAQSEGSAMSERAGGVVAALYAERGAELFHYALALGRNEELAKDALQEAFMRYFVALCQGEQIAAPRAWIYRVLRNYLLDRLKHMRAHEERGLARALPYQQDIEGECLQHEILRLARAALTAREFDCLRLRTEGMRYAEIAARLSLTSGSVGTLVSRALHKIRVILSPAPAESR